MTSVVAPVGGSMQGPELDRRAKLRAYVRSLIADLLRLGFTRDQLRNLTVLELVEMRQRGYAHLMGAPKAEGGG